MPEQYATSFRIGGDPEFAIINTDGSYHNFHSVSNAIGADHGGMVVELRPAPSYTVNGFLNNVKTLLESPSLNDVRPKKWRAGAHVHVRHPSYGETGISMGGHVHLEIPYNYNSGTIPSVSREVFMARMEAFDHLTQMFEEANLLPKEECALRRSSSGCYGRFGVGHNHHTVLGADNQQRIEYRSPCSWLFNPRNAFMLITGLKLAAASPVAVMKNIQGGSDTKIFEGIVKLFRNFAAVDHDAYIAANKICRSAKSENLDRLRAIVDTDFKAAWKPRTTKSMTVSIDPPATAVVTR